MGNAIVGKEYKVAGTDEVRVATEFDVIVNEEIVGSDPDVNVRAAMIRDGNNQFD